MNTKLIVSLLIGIIAIGGVGNIVSASDADTPWSGTVKWTIPSDTSFTVTLAGGADTIDFNASGTTDVRVEPAGQDNSTSTAIIVITNTGNQALNFNMSVPEGCPSWAVLRIGNTTTFGDSTVVNKTGHIVGTAIAAAGTQDVYMWTNVTSAPIGMVSKTAYINSST